MLGPAAAAVPAVAILAAAAVPVFAADALLCLAVSFSYLQRNPQTDAKWLACRLPVQQQFGHLSCVCVPERFKNSQRYLSPLTNSIQHDRWHKTVQQYEGTCGLGWRHSQEVCTALHSGAISGATPHTRQSNTIGKQHADLHCKLSTLHNSQLVY